MLADLSIRIRRNRRRRRSCATGGTLALLVSTVALLAGCDDRSAERFRLAAVDAVQSGFISIAEGLITGAFTLATPESADTTGGTTGDTTGATAQ
jgi:cobalamin synthase